VGLILATPEPLTPWIYDLQKDGIQALKMPIYEDFKGNYEYF
jgi:hypothetical protein